MCEIHDDISDFFFSHFWWPLWKRQILQILMWQLAAFKKLESLFLFQLAGHAGFPAQAVLKDLGANNIQLPTKDISDRESE